MKKEFGFILFDNINEFEKYLNNEKVTRKISRLQVHHMSLPNYHTWDTTDKKIYKNNRELGRTKALDDFGFIDLRCGKTKRRRCTVGSHKTFCKIKLLKA